MMKILILAGLLVAASSAHAAVELGEPFTLHIGESAEVGDGGLVITLVELLHDSRCPALVTCVWEGVAEFMLRGEAPALPAEEFTIASESSASEFFPTSARYGEYLIRFEFLLPLRTHTGPIDPGLYELTLVVDQAAVPTEARGWSMLKSRYRD